MNPCAPRASRRATSTDIVRPGTRRSVAVAPRAAGVRYPVRVAGEPESFDYRLLVGLIFLGFAVAELLTGRLFQRDKTTLKDVIIEIGSGFGLPMLVVPAVLTASGALTEWLLPDSVGSLAHWPAWAMLLVLLVADDLTQYGWHRLSHSSSTLYRLHRAHHSAEYLSVRCVYRNNIIYYALMPGIWLSGVLLHLGFGPVYAVYFVAKMFVITGAHSSVPWDEPLARSPKTRWLFVLLAHIISTPRTHAAHHGKHAADGVTHYHGNYGNFLFLWDVVFGTAKFSSTRPVEFGLENVQPQGWFRELIWPFGRGR